MIIKNKLINKTVILGIPIHIYRVTRNSYNISNVSKFKHIKTRNIKVRVFYQSGTIKEPILNSCTKVE